MLGYHTYVGATWNKMVCCVPSGCEMAAFVSPVGSPQRGFYEWNHVWSGSVKSSLMANEFPSPLSTRPTPCPVSYPLGRKDAGDGGGFKQWWQPWSAMNSCPQWKSDRVAGVLFCGCGFDLWECWFLLGPSLELPLEALSALPKADQKRTDWVIHTHMGKVSRMLC